MTTTLVLISMLLNAGTSPSSTDRVCGFDHSDKAALTNVLQRNWSSITIDDLSPLWKHATPWLAQARSPEPCSGTTTLSNLARVTANECECCDTFLFTEESTPSEICTQHLSSITIIRAVPNVAAAKVLAKRFREIIMTTPEIALTEDDLGFSSVAWPSKTINQSANLSVFNAGNNYLLRLTIYRTTVPEQ